MRPILAAAQLVVAATALQACSLASPPKVVTTHIGAQVIYKQVSDAAMRRVESDCGLVSRQAAPSKAGPSYNYVFSRDFKGTLDCLNRHKDEVARVGIPD